MKTRGPIYIMKASNEAASNGVFQFFVIHFSFFKYLNWLHNFISLPLFDGGQVFQIFISLFGNNKLTNKILMLYNFIGIFIFATLIFLFNLL